MTDEELAKRLGTAASIGWNEPEPYRTELTTLAASRLRHLTAVERAAREYDTAFTDNIDLDCDASLLRVHKARAKLRSALEGGK
jgi:hypothetical protein